METDDLLTAHPVLPEESLWDTRKWATVLHVAQAILDALPMATMMLDVEWRVVLVNRKLEELFEVSEKRIVGAPLSKLLPHKEVAEIMSRGQQERGPQEVELTLTPPRAQGRIFRAVIADVELGIKENQPRTLVMLEDISDKVHLTEHLIQSEKRAAMGELALTIAHELGNPLSLINSTVQFVRHQLITPQNEDAAPRPGVRSAMLLAQGPLSRESVDVSLELDLIADNVQRMHELLKSLSDLASPERLRFEWADIHEALSRVLAFVQREAESHHITIEPTFDEHLPPCWVDVKQLKQVFLNLFKNALEAMPYGGRLSIRTQRLAADLLNPEGAVLIEVSDTGSGIPESEFNAVSKPFYSTKPQGSGLGLFFCQQAIEKHGGSLSVRSQVGTGTTFSLRLPISRGREEMSQ